MQKEMETIEEFSRGSLSRNDSKTDERGTLLKRSLSATKLSELITEDRLGKRDGSILGKISKFDDVAKRIKEASEMEENDEGDDKLKGDAKN